MRCLLRPMLLALAFVSAAAPRTPAAAQTSPRCAGPEFRQLDFWIGTWTVTDPDGDVMGESTVVPTLDGCAVREDWSSGQMHGTSINAFDKPEAVWRQMWVDNLGAVLRLAGDWQQDRMVLVGDRLGSDGKTRRLRVTLSQRDDGTLRQVQERSEDGGRTWTVIFEGRYTPKGARPDDSV